MFQSGLGGASNPYNTGGGGLVDEEDDESQGKKKFNLNDILSKPRPVIEEDQLVSKPTKVQLDSGGFGD